MKFTCRKKYSKECISTSSSRIQLRLSTLSFNFAYRLRRQEFNFAYRLCRQEINFAGQRSRQEASDNLKKTSSLKEKKIEREKED
jgi:hypothetical protein